jgi:hypothetical protein
LCEVLPQLPQDDLGGYLPAEGSEIVAPTRQSARRFL